MTEETEYTEEQPHADSTERPISERICPVVGIGASAGGVDALRRLLPQLEPGCGMAFVVVQHLDPDHTSLLSELLARSTALPVAPIENDSLIEPDRVFVIPPNTSLTIRGNRLQLAPPVGARGHRNTIDEFLTSLAHDQAENAACVILSGTGSDGTLGLRAIKENGGLTLAQSDAEYDGMMRSAMSTGLVDFTLPLEEIPAKLADFFDHVNRAEGPAKRTGADSEAAAHLGQIITLLRDQTGHDFSNYKDRTIIRRIQRRMHVLQIDNVPGFIDRLRRDSREVTLLFHDLLIGVTNFFRDPDAFAALEREVIPQLFKDKGADDIIRVWVPGCATGEEAYSIAMLLRDYGPKSQAAPRLQVFASDIDAHALETARIGRYPATISKDVPPQRLERYFLREDGTLRIASDLREICLFAQHNLLRDAPFSKLDLISCRNLLIYLSSDLQDRVISLFHYALGPERYLFLGPSENVTRHPRLFSSVDKVHRIFQRRTYGSRRIPEFPLIGPETPRRRRPAPAPHAGAMEPDLRSIAERQLLERFAPAFVVVNAEGEVLQSSGRTGKYLELPPGSPDTNIFNMARSGLRLELRATVHKAVTTGQLAAQTQVNVSTNGGKQEVDLFVQPLRFGLSPEPLFMIVFQDVGGIKPLVEAETLLTGDHEAAGVRELEAELRATRERLQTTAEELESSNEELKSSNEELQSINEELQSTNEELETSKEELQSINEELQTVNAELNARVDELSRANNDMANLLDSTQIATVFLDRTLAVKSFTPAAKDVFRLVESDTGRPIMHVRARFDSEGLQEDAERVLRTLATIERPIRVSESKALYMMRVLPYRTTDNVIEGVVLTFTDVTRITAAEARIEELTSSLRARVDELETILDLAPSGVMITGSDRDSAVLINAYGARLLGAEEGHKGLRPISVPFRLFENDKELASDSYPLERAARGESALTSQGRLENHRGESAYVMISATPLFGEGGKVRGAVATIVDMSEHKRAEEQQQFLLHELQHRVKNILATTTSLAQRMLRGRRSVAEFRDAFLGRLVAMGRTHDLLTSGARSGASLRSVIEVGIASHVSAGKQNVVLDGKELILRPNVATTLGMVFHELATNAAKYGALSRAGGQVEVAWKVVEADANGGRHVRFAWTELGGPQVDGSRPSGFGTEFITRSVKYELGGSVVWEREQEGLRCTIEFPTAGSVETAPSGYEA